MERRFLLDVVVRKRVSVFDGSAGEDEFLLLGRDSLLVLDLRLDVLDGVSRLDLKRDGLARQVLDENLHRRRIRHETENESGRQPSGERWVMHLHGAKSTTSLSVAKARLCARGRSVAAAEGMKPIAISRGNVRRSGARPRASFSTRKAMVMECRCRKPPRPRGRRCGSTRGIRRGRGPCRGP